jgi:hypothetical protein
MNTGPPMVAPNSLRRKSGGVGTLNARAVSAGLRWAQKAVPWNSLVPLFEIMLTMPLPTDPYCAE